MRLALALLLSLAVSPAFAEDISVKITGVERGKSYSLTYNADGSITVVPLQVVTVGGAPSPTPAPEPTTLQKQVQQITAAAIAAGGTKTTAAGLSAAYSLVADAVANGSVPPDKAFDATRQATEKILALQADRDKWTAWRTELSKPLTALRDAGLLATKEQVAAVMREIAAGIDAVTGINVTLPKAGMSAKAIGDYLDLKLKAYSNSATAQPGLFDGIDFKQLFELIKMILDLIKSFSGGF